MSNTSIIDSQDRIFTSYLKEISTTYHILPKPLRLRVEKWIEKLSSIGNNPTWKKHRNAYVRLLLNHVLAKNLTEPFHCNPPDGPLATFPSHLRCQLKSLLGAHESSFWREIFSQVNERSSTTPRQEVMYDNKETNSRDIQDMTLLIKEQAKRIELLEQQLHDERLQNELQAQRTQYAHRIELEKLRKSFQQSKNTPNYKSVHHSNDNDFMKTRNESANMNALGNATMLKPDSNSILRGDLQNPMESGLSWKSNGYGSNPTSTSVSEPFLEDRNTDENSIHISNDYNPNKAVSQSWDGISGGQSGSVNTNNSLDMGVTIKAAHDQQYRHRNPPTAPSFEYIKKQVTSSLNKGTDGSDSMNGEMVRTSQSEHIASDIGSSFSRTMKTQGTLPSSTKHTQDQQSLDNDEFLAYTRKFQEVVRNM